MEFIVQTLKPVIDLNFRTKPERAHTHIAGSSMGGLISLYGAMHFPETFGGAGIFSPSLWLVPNAAKDLQTVAQTNLRYPQRFYFYGGAKESEDMVTQIFTVANLLYKYPSYTVQVEIDPEGQHHEQHWRNKFSDYYTWLAEETQ